MIVVGVAAVLRPPLAAVPENWMKFFVGAMLSSFGVFWFGASPSEITTEAATTTARLRRSAVPTCVRIASPAAARTNDLEAGEDCPRHPTSRECAHL